MINGDEEYVSLLINPLFSFRLTNTHSGGKGGTDRERASPRPSKVKKEEKKKKGFTGSHYSAHAAATTLPLGALLTAGAGPERATWVVIASWSQIHRRQSHSLAYRIHA